MLWLITFMLIVVSGVSLWTLLKFRQEVSELRGTFKDQSSDLTDKLHQHLSENTRFLLETQKGYNQSISDLGSRLGQLQEATRSMMDIGKDISSLQDILRAPKLRGGFGELLLGELLREILPEEHFVLQYTFDSGNKVDAIIRLNEGLIPVDAKFPLENFKRLIQEEEDNPEAYRKKFVQDVKKHVDAIASKYILPEEGTFEFALMYIPAENVYYETILKQDNPGESITDYALKKKVIPVSPNSFYAYLQAIARGLKGMRIEKSARLILQGLGQLDTDFKKCQVDLEKMGTHLSSAQSAFERTQKRFSRLQDKLDKLEGYQAPGSGSKLEGEARAIAGDVSE